MLFKWMRIAGGLLLSVCVLGAGTLGCGNEKEKQRTQQQQARRQAAKAPNRIAWKKLKNQIRTSKTFTAQVTLEGADSMDMVVHGSTEGRLSALDAKSGTRWLWTNDKVTRTVGTAAPESRGDLVPFFKGFNQRARRGFTKVKTTFEEPDAGLTKASARYWVHLVLPAGKSEPVPQVWFGYGEDADLDVFVWSQPTRSLVARVNKVEWNSTLPADAFTDSSAGAAAPAAAPAAPAPAP